MLKKLTAAALAIALTVGAAALPMAESGVNFASITASAEDLASYSLFYDDYDYTILDNRTIEITTYIGNESNVIIPSSINGKKVTSIGNSAFSDCTNVTSITIPDGVTSIGGSAFYKCENLTSIKIPDSVTSIGGAAFSDCTRLTNITIPYSVTSIGDFAFYKCENLTSIKIPDGVTSIGESTFTNCYDLANITIPDSVTGIGDFAFSNCYDLTNIIMPDSVKILGKFVFLGCISLKSAKISNSVKILKDYVFGGCTSLTSITIPNSVTSIGERVFFNCTSLKSITIPYSVTSIGESAFGYASDSDSYNDVKIPGFKIYCYEYTAGEKYAINNKFDYEFFDHTTHTWDSGKITKAATYSSTGTKTYTCKICGETKTTTIPKKVVPTVTAKTSYTKSTTAVRVNWNKVSEAEGYKIERYNDSTKKWVNVGKVTKNTTLNYKDSGLAPGKTYKYRVRAYKIVGGKAYYGAYSSTITTKTDAVPKVTAKTTFTCTSNAVRINWNKASNVSGYKVLRYNTSKKKWETIKTISGNKTFTYLDSNRKAGTTYKYCVKAYVKSGSAVYYGTASSTITTATKPAATAVTKSAKATTAIRLYWKKVSCTGYRIDRYDSAKKKWVKVKAVESSKTTEYRISGLKKNTTYKFRIVPYVKVGTKCVYGAASSTYTVKTSK